MWDPSSRSAELEQLWSEFLTEWPLERLRRMTLPEYTTAGDRSCFVMWIESRLDQVGSIWGGSAFKFGIYSRVDRAPHASVGGRMYGTEYAWMKRYGATPEEAFEKVRSLVVAVAEAAANAEYEAIDAIDLGHVYKWKIAFHYQDRTRPGVVALFVKSHLRSWVAARMENPPTKTSQLYREILARSEGRSLLEMTGKVWRETIGRHTDRWQELIRWAALYYRQESFDADERDYKLEIARNLQRAREELTQGGEWFDAVKRAFGRPNNLTPWRVNDSFFRWCAASPEAASDALACIWDDTRPVDERFRGFFERLPKESIGTPGARICLASFLHMALDATGFPIYRATAFETAYRLTRFPPPAKGASEWEVYEHALKFLDRFLEEAARGELELRDRLDAQGLLWSITRFEKWEPGFLSPEEQAALRAFLGLPPVAIRYWKIAPGEDAWQWAECRDGGFIALGWDELGDLSELSEEELQGQLEELRPAHPDWGAQGPEQAWQLSRIRTGDRIVANQGTTKVLGIGTVTGSYYFESGTRQSHRLPVRWDDTTPRTVEQGGWRRTLIELTAEQFEAIMKPPADAGTGMPAAPRRVSLAECAARTGIAEATLSRWLRALERKGQAIFYGPPGTGKTFVAEHLADHLVSRGNGFKEVLQLHPAYAYEDFIQGIRPRLAEGGGLTYEIEAGSFLRFCRRAAELGSDDLCVLILDEINRANLARVFGELMYLLEYRDRKMPLAAGGWLQVPGNVRILGTMNTADRSIALVDHALRRRFAFLELRPDFELLRRKLAGQQDSVDVDALIRLLKQVNQTIGDSHYEVGISFFLRERLDTHLEEIWRMEILPYLDEYFFDNPSRVEPFAWERIAGRLLRGE